MSQKNAIASKDIAGLDAGLPLVSGPPEERFFQGLVDYFIRWLRAHSTSIAAGLIKRDQALLMLYSESPKLEPGLPASVNTQPTEVYSALLMVDEGVAVAGENLSEVIQYLPDFKNGATEAYKFARDHLKADQTFALLLFGQSRMLVHDKGIEIDDWIRDPRVVEIKQLDASLITPAQIEEELNTFHKVQLESYRGTQARLMWQIFEEPKKSVLGPKPELHVQSAMLTHFRGIYRGKNALVDEEVTLNEGRVDLRIARFDPASNEVITMIELKVLKPDKNDADNLEWAHKGIEQAYGYKKTISTDAAFACIYDARRSKIDSMPTLQPDADAKGVILKLHAMEVPWPRPLKKSKEDVATEAKPAKAPRATPSGKTTALKPGTKRATKSSPKAI